MSAMQQARGIAAAPAESLWGRRSIRTAFVKTLSYTLIVGIGAVLMVPLLWMLSTSLKPPTEIYEYPPRWIPSQLVWDNYPNALTFFPFLTALRNTVNITAVVIIGHLLTASVVAFSFARVRFRGRDGLFLLVLSTMMIPYQVTLIPTYIIFKYLGWLDSFLPLTVPAFLGGGAFNIFLLRQFFMTIPLEMDDAARIDGSGTLGLYWRIILPLSKPALATVAIFTFMGTWNDFMGPLIYLNTPAKQTLAICLAYFKSGAYGLNPNWAFLMAASIVIMLPCLLLFFFAQKYFIQGVVVSGVKG